jgi:hypoxanthine-guanine phosphoribosyltransferase
VGDSRAVMGQHILVIDDIFTTGSTARAVTQVLLASGAASVWIATLTRAVRAYNYRGRIEAVYLNRNSVDPPGIDPDGRREPASMLSSPNQPSF